MMRNFILFFLVSIASSSFYLNAADEQPITWLTNYDEAVNQSRNTSKPILMLFTGSDWCSWCTKLEQEVFHTREFAQTAGNSFIFLKLDFPLYSPQDPNLTAQNKLLQKKFEVRSYPTVILFDGQKSQRIGVVGYRPGGPRQYAAYLQKMVSDSNQYQHR